MERHWVIRLAELIDEEVVGALITTGHRDKATELIYDWVEFIDGWATNSSPIGALTGDEFAEVRAHLDRLVSLLE